jgi:hypothetical protein
VAKHVRGRQDVTPHRGGATPALAHLDRAISINSHQTALAMQGEVKSSSRVALGHRCPHRDYVVVTASQLPLEEEVQVVRQHGGVVEIHRARRDPVTETVVFTVWT